VELCRSALELGVRSVVLTRGQRGVLVVEADRKYEVPALKVDAVDTTGAGDAFTACLSVAAGTSLEEAVRLASVAGAHACLSLGVVPSLKPG
jgi:ribokinase